MERKRQKNLWTGILMLFLLPLFIFLVFHGHAREIWDNIRSVPIGWLLVLLGLGVVYQLLESAVCQTLVKPQLQGFSFRQAVEVVFLGVFANVATFGVGTIPMQSRRLHRLGLTAGSGLGTMTLEYAFHKETILLYTTVLLLLQGRWMISADTGLSRWLLLGYGICALIVLGLLLLCAWEKIHRLACLGIDRLPKSWETHKGVWKENLDALYTQSQRLLHDRRRLGQVLVWNILKLFCLYLTLFLSVRMVGVSGLSLWQIQLLGGLMHMIVNALPNVAGMGPAEVAFLLIFSGYMEYGQLSSALILYRTATFFFPFVLSVFAVLVTQKRISGTGT